MRSIRIKAAMLLSIAAGASLTACTRGADLTCDDIARRSQELSQSQPMKFSEIRDVREVSSTEQERRCTGTGVTATGQTIPLTLRGYEENGNQLFAYEGTAPAPSGPAPAETAPTEGAPAEAPPSQ